MAAKCELLHNLECEQASEARRAKQRAEAAVLKKARAREARVAQRWDDTVRRPLEEEILRKEDAVHQDRGFDRSNPPLRSVLRRAPSLPPDEAIAQLTAALARHHATGSVDLVRQVKAMRDGLRPQKA